MKRTFSADNASFKPDDSPSLSADIDSPAGSTDGTPAGSDTDEDIEACSDDDIDIHQAAQGPRETPPFQKAAQVRVLRDCIFENLDDLLRYAALIRQYSRTKTKSRADHYSPPVSDDNSSTNGDEHHDRKKPSLSVKFSNHAEYVLQREFGPQRYADLSLIGLVYGAQ